MASGAGSRLAPNPPPEEDRVSDRDQSEQPQVDPEPEYEPPRAEEIAGDDRAATASWVQTGFPVEVE